MRGLLFLLLIVCLFALRSLEPAFAWAKAPQVWVRVLLEEAKEAAVRTPTGEVFLRLSSTGVVADGGGRQATLNRVVLEGPFWLGGRRYRGQLLVLPVFGPQGNPSSSRLLLINVLPLEEYLLGVLPLEMPRSFPEEALLAQAVLARTYAISRLSPKAPYDLCATPLCQAYGGMGVETPVHREAVEATRGQVVTFGGRPVSALYHSDSGGMTAASEEVYGRFVPYLRPRPDPYSPRKAWAVRIPWPRLLDLAPWGRLGGRQEGLVLLGRSESGRAYRIRTFGKELEGPKATRFLRSLGLPSTSLEEVQTLPEGILVRGRGAGHGLGLSQWGAKGMAEAGYGYREILGYYFPGTFLSEILPN